MAFNEKGFIQAARQAGYSDEEIGRVVGSKRKGLSKWLYGNRISGVGKFGEAVGNVLNLPSYAIGGMLDETQKQGAQAFNPLKNPFGIKGAVSGIKNKEAVFTELPETFGIDPNSGAGMALGFAGELVTPGAPLGKAGKALSFLKGGKAASRLSKPGMFAKIGGVKNEMGRKLLEKSYKLNSTDINKIAQAIGVTDESKKVDAVIDYLEGLKLGGATKSSMRTLDNLADSVQKKYNSMVRTGKPVNRTTYANALMQQADELEQFAGDPTTRSAVQALRDEAKVQLNFAKQGVPMTDEFLTNTKTTALSNASAKTIASPFEISRNEQIGRAGIRALEDVAPGSSKVGTELRGLRTAQEVVGKQARTGLGTQLINAFKPSAIGMAGGAAYGYSQGENPLVTGLGGAVGVASLTTPTMLNKYGKVLRGSSVVPESVKTGMNAGGRVMRNLPTTTARLSLTNPTDQANQQPNISPPLQFPRQEETTTSGGLLQHTQKSAPTPPPRKFSFYRSPMRQETPEQAKKRLFQTY